MLVVSTYGSQPLNVRRCFGGGEWLGLLGLHLELKLFGFAAKWPV